MVSQWIFYLIALGHENVLVSYEDEVVVSQWMCYLNAFGHENVTCIGYKDEVVVSQWMCYSNAFSGIWWLAPYGRS